MTSYRPQADDTSIDADKVQVRVWRTMSPTEKLCVWAAMQIAVQQIAEVGIRRRHPGATEREVFLRRAALGLDADTMVRVFGWRPC